jgi:acetyl esterase/lipase
MGGVPTADITVDGIEPRHVVLYFHAGVYVIGDAFLVAELASQVGRRTRAKVISVDYRLAPEHPYPAAVDDALAAYEALLHNGIAASDIVFAGESAGGGLAIIATLVNARDHGLPLPAAAFLMSPYADLTLAGTTMETRREVDPLLSRELHIRPDRGRGRVPRRRFRGHPGAADRGARRIGPWRRDRLSLGPVHRHLAVQGRR